MMFNKEEHKTQTLWSGGEEGEMGGGEGERKPFAIVSIYCLVFTLLKQKKFTKMQEKSPLGRKKPRN